MAEDSGNQARVATILSCAISRCKAHYLRMLFEVDDMQYVNSLLEGFEFESNLSHVYGTEYYEITIRVGK